MAPGDPIQGATSVLKSTIPDAKLWLALEQELFVTGIEDKQSQRLFELARSLLIAQKDAPEDGLDIDTLRAIVHLQPVAELQGPHEKEILDRLYKRVSHLLTAHVADVVTVFQDLANLCRDEEWRVPLGDAGFIQLVTYAIVTIDKQDSGWHKDIYFKLHRQALRLAANLCADTDANRERAVQSGLLQAIIDKFAEVKLLHLAIPAAFNICNDYEPAKKTALQHGLLLKCLEGLEIGPIRANKFGMLLDLVSETVDPKDVPPNALEILLNAGLQGQLETDERAGLLNLANKLLADEETQKDAIKNDQVELVLGCLFRTYTETEEVLESIMPRPPPRKNSVVPPEDDHDSEDERLLTPPRKTLVQVLTDISAHREFKEKYEVFTNDTMMVWKLKTVMPSPRVPIAQAACLMLGNLASTDDIAIRMVRDVGVHQAASDILGKAQDIQLIHAVLGLLKNLALPAENKESLAMVGVIEKLQTCWTDGADPQIQLAGVSLMRQMLNGSLENIRRALLMSSPAYDGTGAMKTQIAALIDVWFLTDQLPIKIEVGRTIAAILRCLHGSTIDAETRTAMLADLYSNHSQLGRVLVHMISQSQYPVVRSEGWFALGLLVRDDAGSKLVIGQTSQAEFYKMLEQTIRCGNITDERPRVDADPQAMDTSTDEKPGEPTKDRENALFFVHELLKHQTENVEHLQALISGTPAIP